MNRHPSSRFHRVPRRAGFTLIELLVAGAIMCVVVVGFYSTFLRLNQYAANMRYESAAKIVLEQAVNQVLTLNWDNTVNPLPTLLTDTNGGWVTCNLYGTPTPPLTSGQVLLTIDPTNPIATSRASANTVATLNEMATPVMWVDASSAVYTNAALCRGNSAYSPILFQIVFRIDFQEDGSDQTVPSFYNYTMRARNN